MRARAVWGGMEREERRRVLDDYEAGRIDVVTNCGVLTEGWDCAATAAVLLARPTKSKGLYIQMAGRGFRLHPDKKDCLVMDFVDITGKHDLCGFATLAGDPGVKTRDGESLIEAVERFEAAAGKKAARALAARLEEVDLFRRSDFVWTAIRGGHYRIAADKETYVYVWNEAGGYTVIVAGSRGENRRALTDKPIDLGYAQVIAEDYVRANGVCNLASKSAPWRKKPATEKQLALLRGLKIVHDPDYITAGDASNLIDAEKARRAPASFKPASDKQKWLMRKLGLRFPSNVTSADAGRMIGNAKQTEASRGAAISA